MRIFLPRIAFSLLLVLEAFLMGGPRACAETIMYTGQSAASATSLAFTVSDAAVAQPKCLMAPGQTVCAEDSPAALFVNAGKVTFTQGTDSQSQDFTLALFVGVPAAEKLNGPFTFQDQTKSYQIGKKHYSQVRSGFNEIQAVAVDGKLSNFVFPRTYVITPDSGPPFLLYKQ